MEYTMAIDFIGLTLKIISPKGIFGTTNRKAVKEVFLSASGEHLVGAGIYAERLAEFLYDVSQGLEEHSDLEDKHLDACLDMGGAESNLGLEFIYEFNGEIKPINSPVYTIFSSTLDDKIFGDQWHQMQIYLQSPGSDSEQPCLLSLRTFKTKDHLRVDLVKLLKGSDEEVLLSQSILKSEGGGGFKTGKPMTIKSLRFYSI
jgi:hypothetical protein